MRASNAQNRTSPPLFGSKGVQEKPISDAVDPRMEKEAGAWRVARKCQQESQALGSPLPAPASQFRETGWESSLSNP